MTNLFALAMTRLREASTWRGIVLLLTAVGVKVDPSYQDAIITFGIGLAGLLAVVMPDKLSAPPKE